MKELYVVYVFYVYFYVNVVRVHARVIHYIYDLHEYYMIFLSSFLETRWPLISSSFRPPHLNPFNSDTHHSHHRY